MADRRTHAQLVVVVGRAALYDRLDLQELGTGRAGVVADEREAEAARALHKCRPYELALERARIICEHAEMCACNYLKSIIFNF